MHRCHLLKRLRCFFLNLVLWASSMQSGRYLSPGRAALSWPPCLLPWQGDSKRTSFWSPPVQAARLTLRNWAETGSQICVFHLRWKHVRVGSRVRLVVLGEAQRPVLTAGCIMSSSAYSGRTRSALQLRAFKAEPNNYMSYSNTNVHTSCSTQHYWCCSNQLWTYCYMFKYLWPAYFYTAFRWLEEKKDWKKQLSHNKKDLKPHLY